MTDIVSSHPIALSANDVLQVLSDNLKKLGLHESTRHDILPLDTYTYCGGQRDVFGKVVAASTIYNNTDGSIPEDATVDGIFDKAKERMQSTPVANPKDSLYEALSVAANGNGNAPSADSLRLDMSEEVEGMTRNLVLALSPDSTETSFTFPLPEDLATMVEGAYLSSLRNTPTTRMFTKLAGIVLDRLREYTETLELDEATKAAIARFDSYTSCRWDLKTYLGRFYYKDPAELSALLKEVKNAKDASESLPSSLDPCFTRTMDRGGRGERLFRYLDLDSAAKGPTADLHVELKPWGPNDVFTRHFVLLDGYRFPFPLPTELANLVANAAAQTR